MVSDRGATKSPNDSTTQVAAGGAMRMGAAMMRYWFNRYQAAILNGLAVAMFILLIAAILARNVGPAEKSGRATSGVAELRGSLP